MWRNSSTNPFHLLIKSVRKICFDKLTQFLLDSIKNSLYNLLSAKTFFHHQQATKRVTQKPFFILETYKRVRYEAKNSISLHKSPPTTQHYFRRVNIKKSFSLTFIFFSYSCVRFICLLKSFIVIWRAWMGK